MIRIPKNTTIIGELRCDGATRVDARIEGEGNINGVLYISKSCVWVGDITADKIIVEGIVEGKIIARHKLEIAAIAKVSGSISAPEMYIEKGASINSYVTMPKIGEAIELLKPKINQNTASEHVDELAQRRDPAQYTG